MKYSLGIYKGKKVEITLAEEGGCNVLKGTITNIIAGIDSDLIELDEKTIVNTRYIIKFEIIE